MKNIYSKTINISKDFLDEINKNLHKWSYKLLSKFEYINKLSYTPLGYIEGMDYYRGHKVRIYIVIKEELEDDIYGRFFPFFENDNDFLTLGTIVLDYHYLLFPHGNEDKFLNHKEWINGIKKRMRSLLIHEISHALDPKMELDLSKGSYDNSIYSIYYKNPEEIDAYLSQFKDDLKEELDDNGKELLIDLFNWLRRFDWSLSSINSFPLWHFDYIISLLKYNQDNYDQVKKMIIKKIWWILNSLSQEIKTAQSNYTNFNYDIDKDDKLYI